MVPELNLSKTPTYEEKRTEIRKSAQDFKKAVENHKKETTVLRTFGTELSLSKRNKIRMTEYFETSEQCKECTFKDMEKIDSGKKRKKIMLLRTPSHGMKKNALRFEKLVLNADLPTEIKEFEIAGRKVPLSEIRNKQYKNNKQFDRIFTESQIKEMDRDEIVKELTRIDEFSKSDIYMDINTLQQRFRKFNTTRNLQFWYDGSSISNHSHLLMTVNTLYDKTIHMTNQEYEEKHKKEVDVQSEIEKRYVYILPDVLEMIIN